MTSTLTDDRDRNNRVIIDYSHVFLTLKRREFVCLKDGVVLSQNGIFSVLFIMKIRYIFEKKTVIGCSPEVDE